MKVLGTKISTHSAASVRPGAAACRRTRQPFRANPAKTSSWPQKLKKNLVHPQMIYNLRLVRVSKKRSSDGDENSADEPIDILKVTTIISPRFK
jgi:hypothetical protein